MSSANACAIEAKDGGQSVSLSSRDAAVSDPVASRDSEREEVQDDGDGWSDLGRRCPTQGGDVQGSDSGRHCDAVRRGVRGGFSQNMEVSDRSWPK